MLIASINDFQKFYDELKKRYGRIHGNIFLNTKKLDELFKAKKCYLCRGESSIYIFTPRHDFYDLMYLSGNLETLDSELKQALHDWPYDKNFRISVIAKEPYAGLISSLFERIGFSISKKLIRTKLSRPEDKIIAAMRPFYEECKELLSFAKPGDEREIFEILTDNFDVIADNLPELPEISERIKNNEIAILRKDGKIASLKYFAYKSGIIYSFYDVTRKEYRKGSGFFMALSVFVKKELEARNKIISRSFGWRDATNKKLLKHAKDNNQNFDGVVIYNMLWAHPE